MESTTVLGQPMQKVTETPISINWGSSVCL
jgi:hypothetical protein